MTYLLNLVPASPAFDDTLKKYRSDFEDAAAHFNHQSLHTRNPKALRILDIRDSLLVLELTAKVELPAPAKALRLFTQYLLEHSTISRYTYHSCLFRSVRIADPPPAVSPAGQPAEVLVMDRLTRLLVGELPHRSEYFAALQTLLDCCQDMEGPCLKKYLARMRELMLAEARELGHVPPMTERGDQAV